MHAARPCAAPHEGRLCGQRMLAATPAPITQGQGPRPASAPCASATVSGRTSSARLASSLSTTWRAALQCLVACAAAPQGRSGPRRKQRCPETGKDAGCLAVITGPGSRAPLPATHKSRQSAGRRQSLAVWSVCASRPNQSALLGDGCRASSACCRPQQSALVLKQSVACRARSRLAARAASTPDDGPHAYAATHSARRA